MKTNRFTQILMTAAGMAVFSTTGCAEKATPGDGSTVVDKKAAPTSPEPAPATAAVAPTAAELIATEVAIVAGSARWADFKHNPFDNRVLVMTGLVGLEARVDEQVRELNAKRAGMKASTDTKGWDLAMKEMMDAQAYLSAMVVELGKSTREFWDQNKDKVGRAWDRTQDAYGKVKASTTS